MNLSYTYIENIGKTPPGRVGVSPATVLNVQYWFTFTGTLGRIKGAKAIADCARGRIGGTRLTMLRSPEDTSPFSVRGVFSHFRHSQNTTFRAFSTASPNALSSLGELGSRKLISKAITVAPLATRLSASLP